MDDGSTDETGQVARSLTPVKYIRLRRNFGQTAAMDAGIKAASNKYIVTMDGDLQNDSRDIPRLIQHQDEHGYDCVSGWRKNRQDGFMKKIVSRVANFLRSLVIKDYIQDSGCPLKTYIF